MTLPQFRAGGGLFPNDGKFIIPPNTAGGWSDFPPPYDNPQGIVIGGLVHLEGILRNVAGAGAGSAPTILPFFPLNRRVYVVWTSAGAARIDVEQTGQLTLEAATAANGWVSLSNISFAIS